MASPFDSRLDDTLAADREKERRRQNDAEHVLAADPNRFGSPRHAEFLRSTDTGPTKTKHMRLGEDEVRTVRDVGAAAGIADSDPVTQQLKAHGVDAFGRINPQRLQSIADRMRWRPANTEGMVSQARGLGLDARGQQQGGLDRLGAIASGADNVAQRQGNLQAEIAQRRIASQLASRRGGFSPGAAREAALAQSQAATDIGAQAALGAAQERRAALAQQLAGLQGMRQGDMAQQGADIGAGLGLGQMGSQAAQVQGLTDAQRANLFNTFQGRERFAQGQFLNALSGQPQLPGAGQQALSIAGGIAGLGIGGAMLASDERAKEEATDDGGDIDHLLNALEPKGWRYKPGIEDGGAKRHTGVMAQALEKSDIGKRLVHDGPDGIKRVDYDPRKIGPVIFAALAHLSKRIDKKGIR